MKKLIKLNLGCGEDYREGYVNIDNNTAVNADIYSDFINKIPAKDNSVQYIISQEKKHIMTHII